MLQVVAIAGLSVLAVNARMVHAEGVGPVREPADYRADHYRAPVPETLQGARVVSSEAAEVLWSTGGAVFIDVFPQAPKPSGLPTGTIWRAPKRETIKGAVWLPNVGYGVLRPELEGFFEAELKRLSKGDLSRPLVFYCLRDCWMSWNAAKRAVRLGYRDVVWYPDGTDGWMDFDRPMEAVGPLLSANVARVPSEISKQE